MKEPKHNPNPHGKHGKPIVLPPSTFEDAVKKMLNTPRATCEGCWTKKETGGEEKVSYSGGAFSQ